MQESRVSHVGFSVRLDGASLYDLIQFECLDRERKVLSVRSGARVGLLFFRDGNLVHASAGDAVGEPAVRAMLAWPKGLVTREPASWPAAESIGGPWQGVLLRAATAEDEAAAMDNVVSLRGRDTPPPVGGAIVADAEETSVRTAAVDADGHVRATAGDRGLAESLAYVLELADALGEGLAEGPVTRVEVIAARTVGVAVRDGRGGVGLAFGGREADVARLRELAREVIS